MEFGMSYWIKSEEKYVRSSMKEVWRNLGGLLKNRIMELRGDLN